MALRLARITQKDFYWIWENTDIYDFIEFTNYVKFENFREKIYLKRAKTQH